ncbi:hypothetical protein [Collimonas fungivorans]|uniref:hypothetical protein n=1 Tax=Collimonas fungivorans TaxID=158899 RepID=UPI0011D1F756
MGQFSAQTNNELLSPSIGGADNLKIANLMKQDSSVNFHGWSVPIVVLSCVVLALMAGWLFYSTHYAGREDDWRFERCVRWYLIQQQNESMDTM